MRILIAEDEATSRLLLQKTIEPYASCDCVADGDEAFRLFKEALEASNPYNMLFLDIMMPGKSGQDVLNMVRDYEAEAGISPAEGLRVVMTTSLSDEENIFDAHVSGCDAYLVKPIHREAVLEELGKINLSGE